jgi:hypothetical protein
MLAEPSDCGLALFVSLSVTVLCCPAATGGLVDVMVSVNGFFGAAGASAAAKASARGGKDGDDAQTDAEGWKQHR